MGVATRRRSIFWEPYSNRSQLIELNTVYNIRELVKPFVTGYLSLNILNINDIISFRYFCISGTVFNLSPDANITFILLLLVYNKT